MRTAGGALRPHALRRRRVVSSNPDDTELDAIAALVRTYPPLADDDAQRLLLRVRHGDDAAREQLVEHHLRIVLDEAIARGDRGLEVLDLYQEGGIATIVAINEYAAHSDAAPGLGGFVRRVVGTHLDHALEEAALERAAAEAFVRDARVYETAEVGLRQELARTPTVTEVAALLQWPEERVQLVGDMLNAARELYDSDIAQYLEDEE